MQWVRVAGSEAMIVVIISITVITHDCKDQGYTVHQKGHLLLL